jgi:hypothetical protein
VRLFFVILGVWLLLEMMVWAVDSDRHHHHHPQGKTTTTEKTCFMHAAGFQECR